MLNLNSLRVELLQSEDGHEPQLTTVHENAEALWSAVACYRFALASLLAVEGYTVPLESELAGPKRQQSCRTPQRLRRLTPVFSIEASPIFIAARDLLL